MSQQIILKIDAMNSAFLEKDTGSKLNYSVMDNGLVSIDYFVNWKDDYEEFLSFCQFISSHEHAHLLWELKFSGTDDGVNGIRYWDMHNLSKGSGIFQYLNNFFIEGTKPGDTARSIVTNNDVYAEDGVIAYFVSKMPQLESLTVPSAPNAAFFDSRTGSLKHLTIQAGLSHQNFIKNMAVSNSLNNLITFEFRDYSETYRKGWEEKCTPLQDYFDLFESDALPAIQSLILENSLLSETEIEKLKQSKLGKKLKSLEFRTIKI